MGLEDSYLSQRIDGKKAYNVDMVTVLTEEAVNAQILTFMAKCKWKNTVYFLEATDEEGDNYTFLVDKETDDKNIPDVFEMQDVVKELHEKGSSVFKALEELKLFDLPAGTLYSQEERLQKALEYNFAYAVEVEGGLPDILVRFLRENRGSNSVKNLLKLVTIDPQNNSLYFQQIFKNIKIARLNVKPKGHKIEGVLMIKKQNIDDIDPRMPLKDFWFFHCSIKMDLENVAYRDIVSGDVRKQIEKITNVGNPDTVFDISQLLLDLSTLQMMGSVEIEGVEPKVRQQIGILLGAYFEYMQKCGETVFGHIVLPKPQMDIKYLFTPTRRNFAVAEKALYYLINLQDDKEPVVPNLGNCKDFCFAPVLAGDSGVHGAMIINATKFIPLLREKFEGALQELALDVNAYVKAGVYNFEPKVEINKIGEKQTLTVLENEPWKSSWSYTNEHRQSEQMVWAPPLPFPVASGKIDSRYEASCDTSIGKMEWQGVTYPSYNFLVRIRGWMNFGYNSGSNSGYYYDKSIQYSLGIKINADGRFELLKSARPWDNPISPADRIQISGWGKFCTFGALEGMINSVKDTIDKKVAYFENLSVEKFISDVNTFAGWFMPGCRTFTYNNEGISKYGDLYSCVNYIQE